tara:strand:- start:12 stop:311 length:300 start_codon:yes stop_codon:yes gene_type:complete
MAVTHKLIQQRPSAEVDFWSTDQADIIARVEEYKTAGKIISYDFTGTISEDLLVKTMSVTFNNDDAYQEYMNDDILNVNTDKRVKHCEDNSISWSVEQA